MKKIFNDACDKNVATVVLYANDSNELFYDAEFEEAVEAADVFNLFIKGVVAVKAGVYYKPLTCTEAGVISFGFAS